MTERLYVLGHPVAHSRSPVMHNAAYEALGLDWSYGFADEPTEEDARAFLASQDWLAINITMPYKPLALASASEATEEATLAGGANVLIRQGDTLFADNTDGRGCISYLQREGADFEGASVVICGTGPTSQAMMHAARKAGAERLYLVGRDGQRARTVVADYLVICPQENLGLVQGLSYEEASKAIEEANIILDGTPLGMAEGDPAPFDTDLLQRGQIVFDVVYGHGETTLMEAAKAAGCSAYDGRGMLVQQAIESIYDVVDRCDVDVDPRSIDLFPLMAEAAGFSF